MGLRKAPVVDSEEMATQRRDELDIPRDRARFLGVLALAAIREGRYVTDDGQTVDWTAEVKKALAARVSIPPQAILSAPPRERFRETRVEVANETRHVAFAITDWSPERRFLRPFSEVFSSPG